MELVGHNYFWEHAFGRFGDNVSILNIAFIYFWHVARGWGEEDLVFIAIPLSN